MLFTLECLRAKKGDALLLHVGEDGDRKLIVIDGGPSGVYRQSLKPRLEAIRAARTPHDELTIDLLMISHIDDDHIKGILDLTDELSEQLEDDEPRPWRIANLWHNSFDDLVGSESDALASTAAAEVGAASTDGTFDSDAISEHGGLVLASVRQGRALRHNASKLSLRINEPTGGLIVAGGDEDTIAPPGVDGLTLQLLGPSAERVAALQSDWAKKLPKILAKENAGAHAAAYLDASVYNLASLVTLARVGDKTILLTGDARGDDTLEAAHAAGLLDDGPLHVDVLKLPHHGSDRNVAQDFFDAFTADHYVVSGDGAHGNPELATFEMLFASRRGDDRPFTLVMTYGPDELKPYHGKDYPLAELEAMFESERQAGSHFSVRVPGDGERSVSIDLLDPYDGR